MLWGKDAQTLRPLLGRHPSSPRRIRRRCRPTAVSSAPSRSPGRTRCWPSRAANRSTGRCDPVRRIRPPTAVLDDRRSVPSADRRAVRRRHRHLRRALRGAGGAARRWPAEWQLTESTVSLAVSVATGALALSVLPWAAVADRIGRARAMTISAVVASTAGLLVPLAPSFAVLLVPARHVRARARRAAGAGHGAPGGPGPPGPGVGHRRAVHRRYHDRRADRPGADRRGRRGGRLALGAGHHRRAGGRSRPRSSSSCCRAIAAGPAPPHGRAAGDRGRIRLALADRPVWVFYAQAFLLMGGFVTVYNLLAFRLLDDPYRLPASVVSLLFLTYLVGTVGSSGVGRMVGRFGRRAVLAAAGYGMAVGVALTLATPLWWCWPDWWSPPSASSSPMRLPQPGPVSGCQRPDPRRPRCIPWRTTPDRVWSGSSARWSSTLPVGPARWPW